MADVNQGALALALLAARLKEAGKQGLKRELQKNIRDAAEPLAREIASLGHLEPYFPDRYAAVLAEDLGVRVQNRFSGTSPGVMVRAQARERKRKVAYFDMGLINHPVYARGERRTWNWDNGQTGGMKAGFFTDACERATPEIRSKVLEAMTDTARKITGSG
jgi:hypothetical protein